jgi:hypothetical protein
MIPDVFAVALRVIGLTVGCVVNGPTSVVTNGKGWALSR